MGHLILAVHVQGMNRQSRWDGLLPGSILYAVLRMSMVSCKGKSEIGVRSVGSLDIHRHEVGKSKQFLNALLAGGSLSTLSL